MQMLDHNTVRYSICQANRQRVVATQMGVQNVVEKLYREVVLI